MSTKQDVSFANPTAIIAPDLVAQQQQWQRQQDLIDAMKARAFQPTDGGRGAISWTQGLERLADALLAKSMQKKNDQQMVTMNNAYADRMQKYFGLPGLGGGQTSTPGQPTGASPLATPPANPAPMAPASPDANQGPWPAPSSAPPHPLTQIDPDGPLNSMLGNSGSAPAAAPAGAPPSAAPDPSQMPPQAPQMPSQAPPQAMPPQGMGQPPASYPMSLSGNPQQDFMDYVNNPQAFTEAMIKNHSPVAPAQMMQQAQAAFARGDFATGYAIIGQLQHDQHIAPVVARQGNVVLDPVTMQPKFYNPNTPEGAMPTWGPNGIPTQVSMLPGAEGAIAGVAGASQAGKNQYEPIEAYDSAGNPIFTNRLQAASGDPNIRPAPPLGGRAAADVQGRASADYFNNVATYAQGAPDRIYTLRNIQQLASGPNITLGPGSDGLNKVTGFLSTLGTKTFGLPPLKSASNTGEINKWFAQYGARTAESLGLSGSDARFNTAIHAAPNSEMTTDGLKQVLPTFIGWEVAAKDRGIMAQKYAQTHGLQSGQQFQTEWSQVYDPRIYTWMAEGGLQAVANHVKEIKNPADRAALLQKYDGMKRLGATFSE